MIAWAIPPRRLPRLDFSDRRSRRRPHDGRRAHDADERRVGGGAARARRGARARQPRSAHPLRDPQRLRRRRRRASCRTTRRFWPPRATGIEDLNRRFGPEHADRFFLFHRDRRWNAREHAWMGWERKRGKIEEFNRLLRGATDTSFTRAGRRAGRPPVGALLHHARHRHAAAARRREDSSIGIIAHPLNRPRFDARVGRVTEGYGILQPRVSVTMASAAGSLFARTYAGHTGVDPYTTAVSDVYQDLFDEGIFTGKGLYDVDAFVAVARGPRAGERPAVARPLRGPLRADGARHRRRGRRRLSVERPRARATPAPLGARRLADPVVALSVRAVAHGPAAQSPAAHRRAGRFSTICGAA